MWVQSLSAQWSLGLGPAIGTESTQLGGAVRLRLGSGQRRVGSRPPELTPALPASSPAFACSLPSAWNAAALLSLMAQCFQVELLGGLLLKCAFFRNLQTTLSRTSPSLFPLAFCTTHHTIYFFKSYTSRGCKLRKQTRLSLCASCAPIEPGTCAAISPVW